MGSILNVIATTFVSTTSASPLGIVAPQVSTELPAGVAQQLADAAFSNGQWRQAWGHYLAALSSGEAVVDLARCLLFGGRCALYLADFTSAGRLLATYAETFPTEPEGYFYLGRAFQGAHRDLDALTAFNAATLLS